MLPFKVLCSSSQFTPNNVLNPYSFQSHWCFFLSDTEAVALPNPDAGSAVPHAYIRTPITVHCRRGASLIFSLWSCLILNWNLLLWMNQTAADSLVLIIPSLLAWAGSEEPSLGCAHHPRDFFHAWGKPGGFPLPSWYKSSWIRWLCFCS